MCIECCRKGEGKIKHMVKMLNEIIQADLEEERQYEKNRRAFFKRFFEKNRRDSENLNQ